MRHGFNLRIGQQKGSSAAPVLLKTFERTSRRRIEAEEGRTALLELDQAASLGGIPEAGRDRERHDRRRTEARSTSTRP